MACWPSYTNRSCLGIKNSANKGCCWTKFNNHYFQMHWVSKVWLGEMHHIFNMPFYCSPVLHTLSACLYQLEAWSATDCCQTKDCWQLLCYTNICSSHLLEWSSKICRAEAEPIVFHRFFRSAACTPLLQPTAIFLHTDYPSKKEKIISGVLG